MGQRHSTRNMERQEEEDSATNDNRGENLITMSDDSSDPISSDGEGYSLRRSTHNTTLQAIISALVGRTGDLRGSIDELSSDSDSSDPDYGMWPHYRETRKQKPQKPCGFMVRDLQQSDFASLTRKQLGISKSDLQEKPHVPRKRKGSPKTPESKPPELLIQTRPKVHIPEALMRREIGHFGRKRAFSYGKKCQIMGELLPYRKSILAKHNQKVFCGSHSQSGDMFLSACQDQNIRVYDTSKGGFRLHKTIRARNVGWSVLDTTLSPDSMHLIYSSWSECIHQVNLFGDEEKHESFPLSPEDGRFCIFSLRFSHDGNEILGGANDGFIYLYDRNAQVQSLKIDAHEDDVNAVSFVDSTTHIVASGGDDGMIRIWDRRSLRESQPVPVGTLAGHIDGITYIDPRGDGRHLLSNSKDQSIKLWDIRKFSDTSAVDETRRAVRNQKWDYRWQRVPSNMKHTDKRPLVRGDTSVMTYRGHTVLQTLIRCHFSPAHSTAQQFIYSGCASGAVVIYDALTGEVVKQLHGHKSCVRDVSWHPYQPEIISSSWDYTVAKWDYSERSLDDEIDAVRCRQSSQDDLPRPKRRSARLLLT